MLLGTLRRDMARPRDPPYHPSTEHLQPFMPLHLRHALQYVSEQQLAMATALRRLGTGLRLRVMAEAKVHGRLVVTVTPIAASRTLIGQRYGAPRLDS